MLNYSNALGMVSQVISKISSFAVKAGNGIVTTVGALNVKPGAANIVTGEVSFLLDIRCKA